MCVQVCQGMRAVQGLDDLASDLTKTTTTLDFNYVSFAIDTSAFLKFKHFISAGKLLVAHYLQSSTPSHSLTPEPSSYIPSARLSPRRGTKAPHSADSTARPKSHSPDANHTDAGRVRLLTRRFACPCDGHFVRVGLRAKSAQLNVERSHDALDDAGETAWPTTNETPTEPAGCHGVSSYKATDEC